MGSTRGTEERRRSASVLGGLAVAVAVGALVRAAFLARPGGIVLDSDEAIVGLMATHIVEGRAAPLYFYGQHYLGALEAWCAAAVFAVTGPSAAALRAVPAAFSLVAVALVHALGRRAISPRAGFVAALLFAAPPAGLLSWSVKARGGFMEIVAIGTGALVLADGLLFGSAGAGAAFGLGALLGLGWWVNQQIVYYALPIGLAILVLHRRDPLLRDFGAPAAIGLALALAVREIPRPEDIAARELLASTVATAALVAAATLRRRGAPGAVWGLPVVAVLAGIADDLPGLWGHPLREIVAVGAVVCGFLAAATRAGAGAAAGWTATAAGVAFSAFDWWNPHAAVHAVLAGVAFAIAGLRALAARRVPAAFAAGLAVGAVPFLVALRLEGWRVFDVVRGSGGGDFLEHMAGFLTVSLPMIVGARPFWAVFDFRPGLSVAVVALYLACAVLWVRGPGRGARKAFLAAFLAGVPLVFAASGFGWLTREPRYLLPIYSVLFLIPAAACDDLARRGARYLAVAVVAVLLVVNLSGTSRSLGAGERPLLTGTERVSANHDELVRFLDERSLRTIYTNYWIGYRLAFETGERVVFAPIGGPFVERIPAYGREVRRSDRLAYVVPPSQGLLLEQALATTGVGHRAATASGYVVVHDLERPADDGRRRLPLRPESLTSFRGPEEAGLAVDGDLGTRWGTRAAQQTGMWLAVRLNPAEPVAWLSITTGDFVQDAPRDLQIVIVAADGTERAVLDTRDRPDLRLLLETGRFDLELPGEPLREVRLVQAGAHPIYDWSVAELELWAAPSPAPPA